MPRRPWIPFLTGCLCLLAFAGLRAEGPARALVADGRQRLQLPASAFTALTNATVEGWIRFDAFGNYSRFFDVGRHSRSINITHYERSPNLLFESWHAPSARGALHVAGLLRSNEWAHVAAVCGASGMQLYFNGLPVASNAYPASFAALGPGANARLLRSTWESRNAPLVGALADVRLYRGDRGPAGVARDLLGPPDPSDPSLAAAWTLDGTLEGLRGVRAATATTEPRFEPFARPSPPALPHPAILEGRLATADGRAVSLAHVRLRTRDGRLLAAGRTGTDGHPGAPDIAGPGTFRVAVYETNEPVQLELVHPAGRVESGPLRFSAGEVRSMRFALPARAPGPDTTNQFVRLLVGELAVGEPWLREMAANDLAELGSFPQAAAALAGAMPFEQDPAVRERIVLSLHDMADRSPVAVAALMDEHGALPWARSEDLRNQMRKRPVPAALQPVYTRRTFAMALLFAGIFGSFALLHFFFFLCERQNRTDGVYALFTGSGAAGTIVSEWAQGSAEGWRALVGPTLLAFAYLCGLWTIYSVFTHRVPRRFWIIGGLWLLASIRLVMGSQLGGVPLWLEITVPFIRFAAVLEMLRVTWRAYRARKDGSRLIGGGLVFFFLCGFLGPLFPAGLDSSLIFPLGMSVFIAGASFHLARNFVRTHRALREANVAIARSQAQLHREVAEAEAYLRSLLPARLDVPPVRTDWVFQPSTQLGGDAFGYHWIDADRLAVYLIDVCGHGVGAALLAVSALNTLRSPRFATARFADPVAVLSELNHAFPMEAHHNQYFSAWYGIYDRRDRTLRHASAGHPPSYLVADGLPVQPLHTAGPPIGCNPAATYASGQATVPAGARLLVISDGVFELVKPGGRGMTLREFEAELGKHRWESPAAVLDWARGANGGRPLEDDFSVVQLRFD